MNSFKFEILHTSKKSKARVGKIYTPHGIIDTPNFVAVGTNGTIKAIDNIKLNSIGLQLMFCNTYHLILQPGSTLIKKAGGIHKFINRNTPIITDSGGFQVFSLAYGSVASELKSKGTKKVNSTLIKITEDGAYFRSYRDGKKIFLSPESSVQAQKDIAADIIIPLDELPPYHTDLKTLEESLNRTHRWEKRSLDYHLKDRQNQAMYAVIHGGINKGFREKSAKYLSSLDFDGFAIGGSVGKNKIEMIEMLKFTMNHMPDKKPNHLLGIGDIASLKASIPLGLDTFDSSYPTKAARHGLILSKNKNIKLSRTKNAMNFSAIDENCTCYTCQNYTLSYLHHLFKAKELTVLSLASIHNLHFMVEYMKDIREKILRDEI
ncbi:MAG: Queuine tRNA-ribosyltransferase [Candidatus Anoxychlamydiales bacterium]|nr:Queuine tRNA-ribosyltransferase [Candidatus Anoxychlamydiales bacterium]NGX35695.1 Queuine tRNA-ribosyltransferase [Candidatus Anoxychlamydiales bacterium]